jgi:hypothetical protein
MRSMLTSGKYGRRSLKNLLGKGRSHRRVVSDVH